MSETTSGSGLFVEAERMEHWKNRAVDAEMQVEQLRKALREMRNCMQWCINLGADEQTAKRLRRGVEVIDRVR